MNRTRHAETIHRLGLFAVIIVFGLIGCEVDDMDIRNAPDWTLADQFGTDYVFAQRKYETTQILFFWATWCPYCKALMPHLQSIVAEYGSEIEVVAINIREDGDPVAAIDGAGYQFRLLLNGDQVAEWHGIHTTPGLLIVDRQGKIRFDLSELELPTPDDFDELDNRQKAARRAPAWAAALREALDAMR